MPSSHAHQIDTLLTRLKFNPTKNQLRKVMEVSSVDKTGFISEVLSAMPKEQVVQDKVQELGLLALQLSTRQVEVFEIKSKKVQAAVDNLFTTVGLTSQVDIKDSFPFPIEDKSKLNSLKKGDIYVLLKDDLEINKNKYKRMVVSTVVEKTIEEPIPKEYLSKKGMQSINSTDAKYTMKKVVRTQLFHATYWDNKKNQLILSVDRDSLSNGIAQDQLFLLRRFLMAQGVDPGKAINVFDAIEPIYNSTSGFVTKVGHLTTDGNPVRIPLRNTQGCLKKDNYHQAGEGQGYVHAKFEVSKKWTLVNSEKRNEHVEIYLKGLPKMLDTAQPLSDFSIKSATNLENFYFAIEQVLSSIPTP